MLSEEVTPIEEYSIIQTWYQKLCCMQWNNLKNVLVRRHPKNLRSAFRRRWLRSND